MKKKVINVEVISLIIDILFLFTVIFYAYHELKNILRQPIGVKKTRAEDFTYQIVLAELTGRQLIGGIEFEVGPAEGTDGNFENLAISSEVITRRMRVGSSVPMSPQEKEKLIEVLREAEKESQCIF